MKKIVVLLFTALAVSAFAQKTYKAPTDFVFIPMGQARIDTNLMNVDAFFIQDHEVTVEEYNQFLTDLKRGNQVLFSNCYPDTSKWLTLFSFTYNEPYTKHYHTHMAYKSYPINNITYEAAVEYCKWYSDKYNATKDAAKNGKGLFRLPSEAEWIRAARGDNHDWKFAWAGPYLKDKNCVKLANYLSIDDSNIARDSEGNLYVKIPYSNKPDKYFITSPVKSYEPNHFKLFDMCGNVAEMVNGGKAAKGGSWYDPGYNVNIDHSGTQQPIPSPMVGFRMVFVPIVE